MFTVLIAEKEHIGAIRQQNKLFFEPFLESKELAFCSWDPAGQSLQDAVPGLLDAVGRRKKWRAVIINNCTMQTSMKQNPFDVVDTRALKAIAVPSQQPPPDETIEDWEAAWKEYFAAVAAEKEAIYRAAMEQPLQKLSTWLCFRPEDYIHNEVQEKQDVHDWAMEKLGRDEVKFSVKLELLEKNQYKGELRLKERIRREFLASNRLNVSYPTEVHCISPRSAENNYFDPDAYWNIRQDSQYSSFVDNNMYFDRMRFMAFDMLSPTHRNFRSDYIRFLTSVLIFVSNSVPSSALKARRLYQLEVESDDAPLCTLVTSYDRKLAATAEVIDNEMERIRSEIPGELTDKAAEALFCTQNEVPVVLDSSCNPDALIVELECGLASDCPEDEQAKWAQSYQESEKALNYILKQQNRAVKKGVDRLRFSTDIADSNVSQLTPFQMDDVKYYTECAEDDMVEYIPHKLTEVSRHTDRMHAEAEKIKKLIGTRMTKKMTLGLGIICLSLYLAACLPLIFGNLGTTRAANAAFIMVFGALAVLAIVMVVALLVMRYSLKTAVKAYNTTMQGIMSDVLTGLKNSSRYLGATYNARRGHAIQTYASKNVDEYTKRLRIRIKHKEDIRKKRAYLAEEYGDYLEGSAYCDATMSRPYEYDFDEKTEYAFPAPFLAGDSRQIEFISNGNYVTVPSSYITRIVARMEGIYDN